MGCEPHCDTKWVAAPNDRAVEGSRQARLEREYFLGQVANALTILNGWVYLTQVSSCRASQQRYLGAIQHTVRQLTQLMQHYGQSY